MNMQKTTKVVITWTVVLTISALLIWIIYIYYPSSSGRHKNHFEDVPTYFGVDTVGVINSNITLVANDPNLTNETQDAKLDPSTFFTPIEYNEFTMLNRTGGTMFYTVNGPNSQKYKKYDNISFSSTQYKPPLGINLTYHATYGNYNETSGFQKLPRGTPKEIMTFINPIEYSRYGIITTYIHYRRFPKLSTATPSITDPPEYTKPQSNDNSEWLNILSTDFNHDDDYLIPSIVITDQNILNYWKVHYDYNTNNAKVYTPFKIEMKNHWHYGGIATVRIFIDHGLPLPITPLLAGGGSSGSININSSALGVTLPILPPDPQGDSYTETSQGVPIIIPGAVNESTSGGTGVQGPLVTDTPFDFNNEDAPYYDTLPVQSELKNISTPPFDMLVGTAKFDSPETTTGTLKFKFTFITDKPRITQAQFRNYLSELKPSTIPRNHFILIEKSVAADRIIIKGYVTSSIANITSDYIAFNVSGISAAKQLNNLEFIVYVDPLLYRDYLTNSTALAAQQQSANNATTLAAQQQSANNALAAQQKTANNALAAQQQSANNATTLAARQKAENNATALAAHQRAENNAITLAARQKAENNAITLAARQKAENNAITLAARQKAENNAILAARQKAENNAILAAQQKTGNNAILAAQQKTGNNAILAAQQQSSQAAPNFINSYALNIVDPELYSEYILNLAQTKPLGISNLKTFDSSNNGITFEVSQFNAETLTAVKSYKATSIDIYLIYNSDKTLLVTVQNPATTFAQCSSTSNISCNITGIITSASSIIIPPHVQYNTSVLIPWLRNVGNTGNLPKYRSSDVPPNTPELRSSDVPPNTPELRSSDVPPNTPELPIAYGYNNGEYIAPSLNNRGVPQSPIDAYNRTVHHTNNANYPFAQPSPELERNMTYKLLEKGITMFGTYLNNPMEHVLKHSNPGTFISQIDYKGSTNVYSPYIKMI
jgi:hypothetical protein